MAQGRFGGCRTPTLFPSSAERNSSCRRPHPVPIPLPAASRPLPELCRAQQQLPDDHTRSRSPPPAARTLPSTTAVAGRPLLPTESAYKVRITLRYAFKPASNRHNPALSFRRQHRPDPDPAARSRQPGLDIDAISAGWKRMNHLLPSLLYGKPGRARATVASTSPAIAPCHDG
jgi:hypothetical protein